MTEKKFRLNWREIGATLVVCVSTVAFVAWVWTS